MNRTPEEHWADDEELLENFVLGKVAPPLRMSLQNHAASCEKCRNRVRQEYLLAEGVRSAGRLQIKERLTEGLQRRTDSPPWPRILSIAAVIVVVLGTQVYYWLFLKPPDTPGVMKDSDTLAAYGGRNQDQADPRELSKEPLARKERPSKSAVPGLQGSPEAISPSLVKQEEQKPGLQADGVHPAEHSWWLSGFVTGRATDGKGDSLPEAQAMAPEKESVRSKISPSPAAASINDRGAQAIRVFVKGIDSLPQEISPAAGVPAFLEEREGHCVLTLFLDPALGLPDTSSGETRVRFAADDSLVVDVRGHTIGYRIPRDAVPLLERSP